MDMLLKNIEQLRSDRVLLEAKILEMEVALIREAQETEGLWTRGKTAKYLGISVRHLDTMRMSGKIPCRNISGSIRFHPDDVKRFGVPEGRPA
jgi:hypothetical protein